MTTVGSGDHRPPHQQFSSLGSHPPPTCTGCGSRKSFEPHCASGSWAAARGSEAHQIHAGKGHLAKAPQVASGPLSMGSGNGVISVVLVPCEPPPLLSFSPFSFIFLWCWRSYPGPRAGQVSCLPRSHTPALLPCSNQSVSLSLSVSCFPFLFLSTVFIQQTCMKCLPRARNWGGVGCRGHRDGLCTEPRKGPSGPKTNHSRR